MRIVKNLGTYFYALIHLLSIDGEYYCFSLAEILYPSFGIYITYKIDLLSLIL